LAQAMAAMRWLLVAGVALGRRDAGTPGARQSPLLKDAALFAPDAPPPAAKPAAPDSAAVVAVKKAQDLTEDLKEYKALQARQKAKQEQQAKAAAAKAAEAAKPTPPKEQDLGVAVATPPAPKDVLTPERLKRLEAAASAFNKAAHSVDALDKKAARKPAPAAPAPPKPSAEEVRHQQLVDHANALKEQSKQAVAAFHAKLQGHIEEMRTAVDDAAKAKAAAKEEKRTRRLRRKVHHGLVPAEATPTADPREEEMKMVERGWGRERDSQAEKDSRVPDKAAPIHTVLA